MFSIEDVVHFIQILRGESKMPQENDNVNHPSHYTSNKYEAIDVIEDAISKLPPVESFLTGQVLKYMLRWFFKNGVEDLKKARWYLDRLITKQIDK